jgi:hypothetical protein
MKRPVTPEALEPDELRLVIQVFESPGIVRSQLAEQLRISQATAAASIRKLIGSGALVESGQAPSQGGRRAVQLGIAPGFLTARVIAQLGGEEVDVSVDAGLSHTISPSGEPTKLTSGVPRIGEVGCAEALIYLHSFRQGELSNDMTVGLDIWDWPSAAWGKQGLGVLPLDVGSVLCVNGLCEGNPASLAAAEQVGDLTAMRRADEGVEAIAGALATLATLVRPQRVLFGLLPGFEAFYRPEEIRLRFRRRVEREVRDSVALTFVEASVIDRTIGAGLAVIHRRLLELVSR